MTDASAIEKEDSTAEGSDILPGKALSFYRDLIALCSTEPVRCGWCPATFRRGTVRWLQSDLPKQEP